MTAVFSHGRLRLYLLKLLAESPRHGYELIRLLENRFLGLYAPSAGTIYPRLARLSAEGLVTQSAVGGRKVYEITDAGRAELAQRADELAVLEGEIHASVADLSTLASEIDQQVSGSVRDIKRELREAARDARDTARRGPSGSAGSAGSGAAGSSGTGPPNAAWEQAADQLEEAVAELAREVRRVARDAGLGTSQVRAATAVVASAVTELRRLLRQ